LSRPGTPGVAIQMDCFVAIAPRNDTPKLPMKTEPFLLLFRDSRPEAYAALSPEGRQQLTQQWNDWYDGLAAQGKVQHGTPLQPQGRVVSGAKGELVTDGPYAEGKEVIGGFFWLTVADLDEATAIAKRCPSLPLGLSVEVRAVAECSPLLTDLKGRQPAERQK
jgi:hypothetical protein